VIAFVVTLLVAVYVLGPDLLARWILGFVVPRKSLVLSKSEEITRGIMWSILPFMLAWWLRHWGPWALPANARIDLQLFFSGLYSESFFDQHRTEFFAAADSFYQLNLCLALRLYAIVLCASLFFNYLITKHGAIREWLRYKTGLFGLLRWALSIFVLPRISEWHVVLSQVLLPARQMSIEVDVLTRSGKLYSGRLADKVIASSGDLQSLTLDSPRRFRREQYLEAQKSDPSVKAESYWASIPGNLFLIVASDISTLNIRHIPPVRRFGEKFKDVADALKAIERKVRELEMSRRQAGNS
jgi:hypothetical protein